MKLRRAIGDIVTEARELLKRLRSQERHSLNDVDLHIFRVQLSLLDIELRNMQERRLLGSSSEEASNLPPISPPAEPV